ncbi:putative reverse transcriptase domain-containing protein [Tanacetum coccineum]
MAALVISISLNVSVQSVGSSFLLVILIGSIFVEVSVAPEVGAVAVASPTGVLKLDTHSSSEVDPSESSPPSVSVAPMVSPFLCLDDSESDTEMPEKHVSPTSHDVMLTRWRSRVASRSSSPTTSNLEIPTAPILPTPSVIVAPSSEFPFAPVVAPPEIRQRRAILIRIREDIPIGRLYRTHPGGPCRALTARKSFLIRTCSLDTTVADSSTTPRFVYLPLSRTLRCSEAYLYWRFVPLSTMYPPTTSESSTRDSSSESSAGPSRKRCRSPAATMTSFIHTTRALVPSHVDLLPPLKRFKDSISPEDSVEEDINTDVLEDIKADATAVEVDVGVDVEDEVKDEVEPSDRGTIEVGVDMVAGIDIPDGMFIPNVVEHLEQVEEGLHNIYEHVMEIPLHRIEDIEIGQRELEARSLIAYLSRMRFRRLETFAARHLEHDYHSFCEGDNGNGRNGNGKDGKGGDGDGENENPNENNRDARPVTRECTYQDFMKCQPLNFKGTKGVVGLIRWFEKIEIVFHISNYPEKYQVKYATYTMLNNALTWWNSHKRTIGAETAFAMSWRELMKLMAEIVPEEEDRVEKFIGRLPDNIQGNVIAAEPTRLQDAVRIANNLMDQKLKGYAVKNVENKRRLEVNQRDNHGQQPPFKRLNVGGPCTVRCGKCNKVGHLTRDCKVTNSTTSTQRGQVVNQRVLTCFECGRQGYYMSDYPKLKDQNRGNKAGNENGVGEVRGKAYVLGGGDANPDSNVVKGTFLLNNHYASMIFDQASDRLLLSTTFSALLNVTPDTLDVSYAVKLADERISQTNTVLRGCTLGLLGHPFNINLMPVEFGSFDVIISMDRLAKHHAVIVYNEKIVRIPYGDEALIIQGDRDGKGEKSKLSIISCKTQKYIKKGCLIFLAQITKKKTEDKSKEK